MAVICFISEKRVRNYAFIIVLALSSAPLPVVGLAMYMLGMALVKLYEAFRGKEMRTFWTDVFTPQNIILVIALLPIYFFYYKTNLAVNVGQMNDGTIELYRDWLCVGLLVGLIVAGVALGIVLKVKKKPCAEVFFFSGLLSGILVWSIFNLNLGRSYLAFILLEGAIYLFLIWRGNRREPLFYITWIVMAICPLITVGTSVDFCMRGSIPAVFILMVLCIRYLFDNEGALSQKKLDARKVTVIVLIVALVIGSAPGLREIIRGIEEICAAGRINVVNDWAYSMSNIFEGELEGTDRNFIAADYTHTFFFRYISK